MAATVIESACPNCNNALTVEAPGFHECPACNQLVDVARPAAVKPPPIAGGSTPKGPRKIHPLLAVAVVVGFLLVAGKVVDKMTAVPGATYQKTENTKPQISFDDSFSVIQRAQEVVKSRLKAPSTAKFPDTNSRDYEFFKYTDGSVAECVGVRGWVEAQNSFGAMIRTDWVVRLKRDATGRWELKDVDGL